MDQQESKIEKLIKALHWHIWVVVKNALQNNTPRKS